MNSGDEDDILSTPISNLTNRQLEVLAIIIQEIKIGRRTIAEQMKINESAVKRHL
jgi:DNA-binding CsgD family transcriptional regulator